MSSVYRLLAACLALVTALAPAVAAEPQADPKFHALFDSWTRMDNVASNTGAIAIPSQKPVRDLSFSSNFGVRIDPFRGTAAMHAGVDMPGAIGTPIYATADGVVARAGWSQGYGNLIEIDHGRGIATRYGHLSQIIVAANTRVHRGDLIGLMGSTGRSTGSHLHYEVRIDGRAVNPVPFLEGDDYMLALNKAQAGGLPQVALGGPEVGAPDGEGSGDE